MSPCTVARRDEAKQVEHRQPTCTLARSVWAITLFARLTWIAHGQLRTPVNYRE